MQRTISTRKIIGTLALAGSLFVLGACGEKHAVGDHEHMSEAHHQENHASSEAKPEAEAHHDEHPLFTGAVKSFHDVMSPDWHADEGPARVKSTCANLGSYSLEALKITQEPVPHGVAKADWKKATDTLLDGLTDLGRACHSDRTPFNEGFTNVHDGFHGLKELLEAAK